MGDKTSFVEEIILAIRDIDEKKLDEFERSNDQDPEIGEVILEIKQLCDKLLEYDYFEKSESIFGENGKVEFDFLNGVKKFVNKWERLYRKDLSDRNYDLKRLFKLIVDNAEDII